MITSVNLGFDEARDLLDQLLAAAAKDAKLGAVAICIVDGTGRQLIAAAMDGVKTPSIAVAHDKAVTAAAWRRGTMEFCYAMQDGKWVPAGAKAWSGIDVMAATNAWPSFTPWGGGALVMYEGKVVGAIGVSGRTEAEDHELASSV